MSTLDLFIPLALVLGGLIGMVIYILASAVKQLSQKLSDSNNKLLAIVAAKEGRDAVQALIATSRPPQKEIAGISVNKSTKPINKGGFTIGTGI